MEDPVVFYSVCIKITIVPAKGCSKTEYLSTQLQGAPSSWFQTGQNLCFGHWPRKVQFTLKKN